MSPTPTLTEKYYLEPSFQTAERIESYEQRVAQYVEEHGHLPASLPLREVVTAPGTIEDENLDAWAREFRYEVFEEPDEDGKLFRVVSAGAMVYSAPKMTFTVDSQGPRFPIWIRRIVPRSTFDERMRQCLCVHVERSFVGQLRSPSPMRYMPASK